jgi:peptidyl-dipeptidase A
MFKEYFGRTPSPILRSIPMRFALIVVLALAVMAASSSSWANGSSDAASGPAAQAKAFLDKYLADTAKLERTMQLASWAAANSGKESDFDDWTKAELALRKYHSDPKGYQQVCALLKDGKSLDPLTRRSLEMARLAYAANQLPPEMLQEMVARATEIERMLNTYRAKVDGKEYTNNDLLEMIAKETDSAKRQAYWEGLKQVGEVVSPKLIELAKLRNKAARTLGYKNYWDMRIRLQEHDPAQLTKIFAELETLTNGPFGEMKGKLDGTLAKRFGTTPAKLMPWHYDNPFFQAAPPSAEVDVDEFYKDKTKEEITELARKFYIQIGLPIDKILEKSDLYERPGKDQHAFCTNIDREGDVRTLCNIKPTAEWMDTILHEAGHGVYDYYMDYSMPYNLREPAHAFTTEGIAMLFGALSKTPEWIVTNAGGDPARVKEVAEAIREQRRREQLIFTRWTLVMFNFEKALYENPDQDLNSLWWDYKERYQALVRPPSRDKADWAAKAHFTIAPVYYHNYMLGEMFAAQMRHVIRAQAGAGSSKPFYQQPGIGRLLKEKVFVPGSRWAWPQFVKEATGEELTAKYYAEEVKE